MLNKCWEMNKYAKGAHRKNYEFLIIECTRVLVEIVHAESDPKEGHKGEKVRRWWQWKLRNDWIKFEWDGACAFRQHWTKIEKWKCGERRGQPPAITNARNSPPQQSAAPALCACLFKIVPNAKMRTSALSARAWISQLCCCPLSI